MTEPRVVVVGAGITGLALTHYLAERDVTAVTYEAASEPGGVVRTRTREGRILETGPQRLRLTPALRELVEDVGLAGAIREATPGPVYVYHDGRLREAPLSARAFLRTDLLTWRGKLRVLAEPLTRRGRPEESAASYFTRKFGLEAYERFVGPLFGGIYGSDPAEMPARYALERVFALERREGSLLWAARGHLRSTDRSPAVTFAEGNQQLPRALADAHADRVELDTPVTGIREAPGGSPGNTTDGPGYVVETPDGETVVDRVVLTTPAWVTADLLSGVADGAGALADLRYNPIAVVHLAASLDRSGWGYQVSLGADLRTLGCSWNARMFDRDDVYTAFLGGMRDPGILGASREEIGAIAAREFETVTGAGADAVDVVTDERCFPAYDGSWRALESFEAPPGVELATNYTARMGVPSRVREARALADRLAEATAEP